MKLKFAGSGEASPKRDHQFQLLRARNQFSRTSNTRSNNNNNLFEAIAKENGGGHVVSRTEEDGAVRMKIVVRKQDMMQMLEAMSNRNSKKQANMPALSVEQRLNLLQKKHQILRANNMAKQNWWSSWSPVLQGIPAEL